VDGAVGRAPGIWLEDKGRAAGCRVLIKGRVSAWGRAGAWLGAETDGRLTPSWPERVGAGVELRASPKLFRELGAAGLEAGTCGLPAVCGVKPGLEGPIFRFVSDSGVGEDGGTCGLPVFEVETNPVPTRVGSAALLELGVAVAGACGLRAVGVTPAAPRDIGVRDSMSLPAVVAVGPAVGRTGSPRLLRELPV